MTDIFTYHFILRLLIGLVIILICSLCTRNINIPFEDFCLKKEHEELVQEKQKLRELIK